MFLDEVSITACGGKGGNGLVSWRREKFIAKGGPDGGDGGKGGSVLLVANENTDTLGHFRSQKRFSASPGGNGGRRKKHGKDGADTELTVPPGTLVKSNDAVIADLAESGQHVVIARGGRGGFGNAHFKSSVRQRPDFAERGEPGEEVQVHLELKLVADIGIIGFPSVGKSTLISVLSAAKPKIAEYEFTTLVPNLGVVHVDDRGYVLCDIPGLIEGASEGKGLGDTFLRHIERCGVLLHMIDLSRAMKNGKINPEKLVEDYQTIRGELEAYSPLLSQKREIVVLNKADLTVDDLSRTLEVFHEADIEISATISAAMRSGTDELAKLLLPIVLEERERRVEESDALDTVLPVLTPHLDSQDMRSYQIDHDGDILRVRGDRLEQFVSMTDFSSEGGVRRFRDVLKRIGLANVIAREVDKGSEKIYIGKLDVTEFV